VQKGGLALPHRVGPPNQFATAWKKRICCVVADSWFPFFNLPAEDLRHPGPPATDAQPVMPWPQTIPETIRELTRNRSSERIDSGDQQGMGA